MRIAIIQAAGKHRDRLGVIALAMARVFVAQGHIADVFGPRDELRLSLYDFIVVCAEPAGLFGKLDDKPAALLAQSGSIAGKRSMAVLSKGGLNSARALSRLMSVMEAEGMRVTCGEIVSDGRSAEEAARGAPLERN